MKVKQILADEATVLVWRNAATLKILSGGRFGHAAVMLRTGCLPLLTQKAVWAMRDRLTEIQLDERELKDHSELIGKLLKQHEAAEKRLHTINGQADELSRRYNDQVVKIALQHHNSIVREVAATNRNQRPFLWDFLDDLRLELSPSEYDTVANQFLTMQDRFEDKYSDKALKDNLAQLQRQLAVVRLVQSRLEAKIKLARQLNDNPETIKWSYLDPAFEDNYCFISWWPGGEGVGGGSPVSRLRSMRQALNGSSSSTYGSDMQDEIRSSTGDRLASGEISPRPGQIEVEPGAWGQEPEAVMNVPALGPANRFFGVSTRHMWAWYENFLKEDGTYKMISPTSSCSGVAVLALIAGGAESFKEAPNPRVYMLPNEVEAWINPVIDKIQALNRRAMQFELKYRVTAKSFNSARSGASHPMNDQTLWSLAKFQEVSQERLNPRTGLTADIDKYLLQYHSFKWQESDFPKKYRCLVKIFKLCLECVETKGTEFRNRAPWILAYQCLNVVRTPALREKLSW